MKNLLIVTFCLIFSQISQTQNVQTVCINGEKNVPLTGHFFEASPLSLPLNSGITPERAFSLKHLYLSADYKTKAHPVFQLPLRLKEGANPSNRFVITGFVDHNPGYPGLLNDYNCGLITYDTEGGYNHTGTDFFIWPYPWRSMNNDLVEVVAAAPGTILIKDDGNFDQNCDGSDLPYNGICILHADGSVAWYIHLKKNSLTTMSVGDYVAIGDYLGVVGSSGISLSPHLHFEVYDADENLVDPFAGPCNLTTADSWWQNQIPYLNSSINRLSVHNHLPAFPSCPQPEVTHEQDEFYPGDTCYFISWFRNIFPGDTVEYKLVRPDQSVFSNWLWIAPDTFYTASWNYFYFPFNQNMTGQWTIKAIYKEETYQNSFEFKSQQSVEINKGLLPVNISPNPFQSELVIRPEVSGNLSYSVFDQRGVVVIHGSRNGYNKESITVSTESLKPGLYFIQIELNDKTGVEKLVKLD